MPQMQAQAAQPALGQVQVQASHAVPGSWSQYAGQPLLQAEQPLHTPRAPTTSGGLGICGPGRDSDSPSGAGSPCGTGGGLGGTRPERNARPHQGNQAHPQQGRRHGLRADPQGGIAGGTVCAQPPRLLSGQASRCLAPPTAESGRSRLTAQWAFLTFAPRLIE